jgi:hypothetical protein
MLIWGLLLGLAVGFLASFAFGEIWERPLWSAVGATLGFVAGLMLDSAAFRSFLLRRAGAQWRLFNTVAFAAVWIAGLVGTAAVLGGRQFGGGGLRELLFVLRHVAILSPLWLPLVALAFAIGRKGIDMSLVVVFAICESLALAFMAVIWLRLRM